MGKITLQLLDTLQIPYIVLEPDLSVVKKELTKALNYFNENKGPYAFVFRRGFFKDYEMRFKHLNNYSLTTKEVIQLIMDNLNHEEIIVSTTGYITRELYEYRESRKKDHHKSFYNIGSMGCASSIGLIIALNKPKNRVILFDGDGAAIMQMGAFITIGKYSPSNFVHIIIDNEAHESTGGQPTNSSNIDFVNIALASNYKWGVRVETTEELLKSIDNIKNREGPILILIKIKISSRPELKRPDKSPKKYKEGLMTYLNDLD